MIGLVLLSAVLLSFYDVAKKASVRDNAVMPVLFWSNLSGLACMVLWLLCLQRLAPAFSVSPAFHGWVAIKAALVGASWIFMYYAMRMLPVSIVAPLRATAPFWMLLGAILFFGEVPSLFKGIGMALVLAGYGCFSLAGRAEGIAFWRHRGVWLAFIGTILGAASGLYDKFLLQSLALDRFSMQLWFSFYLVVLMGLWWGAQRIAGLNRTPFRWRWPILGVGACLVAADMAYFKALTYENAAISQIALMRRSGVALTFLLGVLLYKEKAAPWKILGLAVLLVGVAILCWKP